MILRRWVSIGAFGFEILKRYFVPQISKVNLALTMRCNHRCLTCNIWQGNSTAKDEITIEDMNRLFANNNLLWINLTGGEPSLASDFESILTKCLQNTKVTSMTTNGRLPRRIASAVAHALEHSKGSMLVVQVSLFGNPEIHDRMTNTRDSYNDVIETIKELQKLKAGDRLILGLHHVISRYNADEYKHVKQEAERLNVGITFTFEEVSGFYQNTVNSEPQITVPKLGLSTNPISLINRFHVMNVHHKAGCVAGEYSCFIMPDKNVYPCLFNVPDRKSFNLNDTDYKIRPVSFKKDMKWIRKCRGCWNPCESYQMLIFRPWRFFHRLQSKRTGLSDKRQ